MLINAGLAVSRLGLGITNALGLINADPVKHLINTHWHFGDVNAGIKQNGRIFDGDIGYKILGAGNVDLDTAWDAARLAGLEADIQPMP